jgi:hypothetical protein
MNTNTLGYHILTKIGDATREVAEAVSELGSPELAGLHRHFYVARANQTVVMTAGAEAPIAELLRGRKGWREPGNEN